LPLYFFFARLTFDQLPHEFPGSAVFFHQTETDVVELHALNLSFEFLPLRLRRFGAAKIDVDERLAVELRPAVEADAVVQHLGLLVVEVRNGVRFGDSPGADQRFGAHAVLGVPERLVFVAVLVHDLPHPAAAPDERPRQRHAVGVDGEHIEIVFAARFVEAARKFVGVGHAAGDNDRIGIRLANHRSHRLQHLHIALRPLLHRQLGVSAEEISERDIHLVPELKILDLRIAFGEHRHELAEPLVGLLPVGETGPGSVAVDDHQGFDTELLVIGEALVELLQLRLVVNARRSRLFDVIPVNRLPDGFDSGLLQIFRDLFIEAVDVEREFRLRRNFFAVNQIRSPARSALALPAHGIGEIALLLPAGEGREGDQQGGRGGRNDVKPHLNIPHSCIATARSCQSNGSKESFRHGLRSKAGWFFPHERLW